MFLALILIGVYSKFEDLSYGDGLGPREVLWPNAWVSNQIEVSSNYLDTQATIKIYFRVDGPQTNFTGWTAGIKLPSETAFTTSTTVAALSTGLDDWVATITKKLSTDETFGPIHFVLSPTSGGEIYAQDVGLGYIGLLTGAEPAAETLTVSVYQTNSSLAVEVESAVILQFSFVLKDTADLFEGDYFVLTLDNKFAFNKDQAALSWDSTVADSAYFTGLQLAIESNKGPDNIAGNADDTFNVYLYGLNRTVTKGATVTFRISGFTTPTSYRASSSTYSWALKAWRYGTNTLVAQYTGTGPAQEISRGLVTISSWGPNNPLILSTQLVDSITAWFKLSFSAKHSVPKNGVIQVTYANVDLRFKHTDIANAAISNIANAADASIYCTASVSITCAVSAAAQVTVTVGANAILPAGDTVNVYTIARLSGSSYDVSDIVTKTESAGIEIDKLSSADTKRSLARAATGVSAIGTNFRAYLTTSATDINPVSTINSVAKNGFLLQFTSPALPANTQISINLPFSSGSSATAAENSLVFQNSGFNYYSSHTSNLFTTSTFSSSPAAGASVNFGSNSITLGLTAANTATNVLIFYIGAGASTTANDIGNVATPLVPTRASDLKEIVVKFSLVSGSTTTVYYYVVPFYFGPGTLTAPTLTLFCKNLLTASPASISYTPVAYSPPSGYEVHVYFTLGLEGSTADTYTDIDILTSLGLTTSDSFPTSDTTKTFSLTSDKEFYYKATTPLTAQAVTFAVIAPSLTATKKVKVYVDIYVVKGTVRTLAFFGESTPDAAATTTSTALTGTTFTGATSDSYGDKAVNTDFDVTAVITFDSATTISVLAVLPQGFTTVDNDINTKQLVSSSTYSKYNIYYKEGGLTASSNVGTGIYTIKTGWYVKATTPIVIAAVATATFTGGDCKGGTVNVNVITAPTLTISDCKPTALNTYSYNNKVSDVSAQFKSSGIIWIGSIIEITLGTWNPGAVVVTTGNETIAGSIGAGKWTSTTATTKQYPANTVFTVSATGLTIPSTVPTSPAIQSVITGVEYRLGTLVYYKSSAIDTCKTTLTASTAVTSKKSGATMWVFPDVVGAALPYFGLTFTTSIDIPIGSVLKIAGSFRDRSDARNDVWFSKAYSQATVSGGNLEITVSENIATNTKLDVVLDNAFTTLDSTTVANNVLVTVTSNSSPQTTLIDDTGITTVQKYTVKAAPTLAVSAFSHAADLKNPGFATLYQFNLTFDNSTANGFWLHLDASSEYNALPGPTFELADYPGEKFVMGFDNSMNILLCTANHWVITCDIEGSVTSLSIWLYLSNPQAKGSWGVYLTDSSMNLLAKPKYTDSGKELDFSAKLTNSINLYKANPNFANDETGFTHNLELWGFVGVAAAAGSEFTVMFPYPYDLEEDNSASLECSITYYNGETAIESVLPQGTTCEADGNSVTFKIATAKTFANTNWTVFTVNNVVTPASSLKKASWLYDPKDRVFSSYTGKFCAFYGASSTTISAASFDNLNAAFTGFNDNGKWLRLYVQLEKDISLTPGTISGPFSITAQGGDVDAEEIAVSVDSIFDEDGESVSLIELYTEEDDDSIVIDYANPSGEFYIGVSSQVSFGTYYISWKINETPFGSQKQYVRPRNTVLQVSDKVTYRIYPEQTAIYVPSESYSFPVTFTIDTSTRWAVPNEGVELNFVAGSADIEMSFTPNPLVLDYEWPENDVTLQCSNCESGKTYSFNVTLGGTDQAAFKLDNAAASRALKSYSFTAGSQYSAAAVGSVDIANVLSNGFKVTVNSDSNALVTWAVYSDYVSDDFDYSLEGLLETVYVIGSGDYTNPTVEEKLEEREDEIVAIIEDNDNYSDLSKELMNYLRFNPLTGQSLVTAGGKVDITFDTLAPGTTYYFTAYVDNLSGAEIEALNEEQVTLELPDHAELDFSFAGSFSEDDLETALILFFELPAQFFEFGGDEERRLQSSTSVKVYSNPSNPVSPAETANKGLTDLQKATGATISVSPISADDYLDAEITDVEWITDNGIVLELNFTSSTDGQLFCTVVNGSGYETTAENVYAGVDNEGNEAGVEDVDVAAGSVSQSWNFTELEYEPSTYTVSCILCNDFPGDPDCSDLIVTNYTYTGTEDNDSDDDSAGVIIYAVAAYFFI